MIYLITYNDEDGNEQCMYVLEKQITNIEKRGASSLKHFVVLVDSDGNYQQTLNVSNIESV